MAVWGQDNAVQIDDATRRLDIESLLASVSVDSLNASQESARWDPVDDEILLQVMISIVEQNWGGTALLHPGELRRRLIPWQPKIVPILY